MKKLLMITTMLIAVLNMHATLRQVRMYEKPTVELLGGTRFEVPTTVTYEGDTMRIVSDSLLTNVLITLRDVDGNIFLSRNESSIGNTPRSYYVSGLENRYFTVEITAGDERYVGRSHVYLEPDVAAFIMNQQHLGDTVSYYLNFIQAYNETDSYWEIYVDENPKATWPHTMEKYETNIYQDDLDDVYFTYRNDVVFPTENYWGDYQKFSSYPYGNKCNLKPSVPVSSITNSAASNTYAIIMGGGTNKYNNYEEYWNDCSLMYQTLVNRFKIPKANIRVFFGAGTDSIPTIRRADMQGFSTMLMDLDNDNIFDINGSTGTTALTDELISLNSLPNADKAHVFVFFVGKGGVFGNNNPTDITPTIQFWENGSIPFGMWYNNSILTGVLSDLDFYSLNIFFGQDCSKIFMDYFEEEIETLNPSLSRVFTASSQVLNPLCDDKPYHEFVYNWLCALNETNIHYQPQNPFSPFNPNYVLYDYNGDSHITMNEAYSYAYNQSSSTSNYYSSPSTLFSQWAFSNLVPSNPDLFVRDFIDDNGITPSVSSNQLPPTNLASPDVYLRNSNDGNDNQTNEQLSGNSSTAYLYTKVHNRGLTASQGGGQYVHAYWFIPSAFGTGLPWGNPTPGENDYGLIGSEVIGTNVNHGDSIIQEIQWSIPSIILNGNHSSLGFLAMLSNNNSSNVSNANDLKQLINNVFNSNDITYRKTAYASISSLQPSYSVELMKGEDENCEYDILAESSNLSNCSIRETDDRLLVQIIFDDNVAKEEVFHVIQKSKETGKLEDELTLYINRTDSVDNGFGDASTSNCITALSRDITNNIVLVQLEKPASSNTQILVESVSNSVSSQVRAVNEGSTTIQIPVAAITNGIINVSLLINGECVDSKKIL